ncbi:MAG: phosphodiester glycosidase family protein [Selenomonadaceae bacterium]|nr:phosphodiester glycosidase family protein [Selenomonadaceae bacterium]
MIKKFAVMLTAGIIFLTTPTFAQADENFSDEPTVDAPFSKVEPPPLDEDEKNIQPPDNQTQPPLENPQPVIEPQPVPDTRPQPSIENPQSVTEPPPVEEEGLEFLVYNQNGVMAFAIIADHEKYQLRPVLAKGQVRGRATVSQMNDPDAIATINASYFAPSGEILGNTKIDGLTVGTTYFIRSAIGIRADGSTIFGRQTWRGVLQFNSSEVVVAGVDCERPENGVVVYNNYYNATTGTNNFGTEIVVQDDVVSEIFHDAGNNYIPPDGYVISAHGSAAENFSTLYVGDKISFDEDYINVEHGGDFNEAIHIIGAGPTLVKGGEVYVTVDAEQFPNDIRVGRAPRSAVGITQYGDYIFAVVDGRQAHSKGCTLDEWARILKEHFGAIEAINLDGGGSSELVFKGSIINLPSDGHERSVGDALTIVRR